MKREDAIIRLYLTIDAAFKGVMEGQVIRQCGRQPNLTDAEVVRDLHRGSDQPALERLARELAAVEKIDQDKATQKLETVLTKEREKKAA